MHVRTIKSEDPEALRHKQAAGGKARVLATYQWLAMVGTTGTFLYWLAMVLHSVEVKPEIRILMHIATFLLLLLLAMVVGLRIGSALRSTEDL